MIVHVFGKFYLLIDICIINHEFFLRVRDKFTVINAMSVDPLYLQHKHAEKVTDLRVRKKISIFFLEFY